MVRASIAMAVYNGEKYIREQIDSIINMMESNDELVISYEESTDNTLSIIQEYEKNNAGVHVVFDVGHSVESNFNNAVKHCRGEYIFLADQDDVWINDKINKIVDFFETHSDCVVVISNGFSTTETLEIKDDIFEWLKTNSNPIRNYIKGTYLGCQMAFRSSITNNVWPVRVTPPIPHDLWLGVYGSKFGRICLLDEHLILHRLHDKNYSNTSKMKLINVFYNRYIFMLEIMKHSIKIAIKAH